MERFVVWPFRHLISVLHAHEIPFFTCMIVLNYKQLEILECLHNSLNCNLRRSQVTVDQTPGNPLKLQVPPYRRARCRMKHWDILNPRKPEKQEKRNIPYSVDGHRGIVDHFIRLIGVPVCRTRGNSGNNDKSNAFGAEKRMSNSPSKGICSEQLKASPNNWSGYEFQSPPEKE
ncbi:hypothetical protein CLF_108370 [Clonorchis sinensis]|uniref:Uncharacterized protein n=1 Tax=Clonorchis sinensis TaxID=79923 RepID=G7YRK3_CLOSI|nr:hypothetical protein CLF_108370 [Clonorchis sinensis]